MAPNFYMRHKPQVLTPDGHKDIGEWGEWHEAAAHLISQGLAQYVHGIFTMHPFAKIEHEGFYA